MVIFFQAVEEVAANDAVKSAVLISGKPGTFIAGADIQMINAMDSVESAASGSAEAQAFIKEKIEDSKKPIVAAINGACLGMGLEVNFFLKLEYLMKLSLPRSNFHQSLLQE